MKITSKILLIFTKIIKEMKKSDFFNLNNSLNSKNRFDRENLK